MIVLRRKTGQCIRLGKDIRIMITGIEAGAKIRLGIEAPASVPVHRLEVYEKIKAENRAAAQGNALFWLRRSTNDS